MSSILSRIRLLPLLAACAVCLGATSKSCEIANDDSDDDDETSFVTELRLEDADGNQTDTFARGELIEMVLSVRNRLDSDAVVQFDTTLTYDFIVVEENTATVLWRWSALQPVQQLPTELRFDANETKEFSVFWDQTDNLGRFLLAGTYEARGVLVFDEFETDPLAPSQMGSVLKRFTIE